jgi:hypothetical protein
MTWTFEAPDAVMNVAECRYAASRREYEEIDTLPVLWLLDGSPPVSPDVAHTTVRVDCGG